MAAAGSLLTNIACESSVEKPQTNKSIKSQITSAIGEIDLGLPLAHPLYNRVGGERQEASAAPQLMGQVTPEVPAAALICPASASSDTCYV
jgi:hypothetical protein